MGTKIVEIRKRIPKKWLSMTHKEVLYTLKVPTLIKLGKPGKKRSVLISTLLHGNEPSGFIAMVKFIKDYIANNPSYPFNILFLVGNVRGAQEGPFNVRHASDQVDFNRVWFCEKLSHVQYRQAKELLDLIKVENPIAHIDLHNTKGMSPVYTLMMNRHPETVELASVISDKHVYYENKVGTLIMAMEDICPAVGVECGKHFTAEANRQAKKILKNFLEYCTKKARGEIIKTKNHALYTGQVHVKVKKNVGVKISDDISKADMVIPELIDRFNFMDIPVGSTIGITKMKELPIECIYKGKDVADDFFEINCGRVMTKKPCTMIMGKPHEKDIQLESLFHLFVNKEEV